MDNSGQPFRILGPNKIWLSPDAVYWAQIHFPNMSKKAAEEAMGRFLLARSRVDGFESGGRVEFHRPGEIPTVCFDEPVEPIEID